MHDVDPETAIIERDAAVDEQSLAILLDRHAIHADLAEASERKDAQHGPDVAQADFSQERPHKRDEPLDLRRGARSTEMRGYFGPFEPQRFAWPLNPHSSPGRHSPQLMTEPQPSAMAPQFALTSAHVRGVQAETHAPFLHELAPAHVPQSGVS
jgi:hypothetical protein